MKKVLIWLGVALLVFVGAMLSYFFYFTRLASPKDQAMFEKDGLKIQVDYCRPSKKDRLVFGTEEEGALVPWGNYWRLGANQATEIEFNRDLKFVSQTIPAGRYWLYVIPGESSWAVVFNTELGQWGLPGPNKELDLGSIEVPVTSIQDPMEVFTITFTDDGAAPINMNLMWDQTLVSVPISYE